jgi:hypothetical protein
MNQILILRKIRDLSTRIAKKTNPKSQAENLKSRHPHGIPAFFVFAKKRQKKYPAVMSSRATCIKMRI